MSSTEKNTEKIESPFMGTKEASKIWGVSQKTIARWCRENKIAGADHDDDGCPWRIPRDAKPPQRR